MGDCLGRPVIALHQHLACATCIGCDKAKGFGDCGLYIENQTILASTRVQMQSYADILECTFLGGELAGFGWRDHVALGKFAP